MNTDPDSGASRMEEAAVRRFLDRYDRQEKANELLAAVPGASLTATALRTLLAGFDAYRVEAYAAREEQPRRACGAKSWPVGTYTCDRAAGHDGDHGVGTAVRYQWPEYAVVEPSAGGHASRTADYVRDVLTNPDATETEMRGAALAAYVALRQMTQEEA